MRPRRFIFRALLCLPLGAVTTIAIALGLAYLRVPIHSFGGQTVAVGRPAQPSPMGKYTIIAYWWTFQDQHRFGERTLSWMGGPSDQEYPDPPTGRPRLGEPFDSFFNREYLPNPSDRGLDRPTFIVVRAYGWPMRCLWEGETAEGLNSGVSRRGWDGPSYGGIKIAGTPAMGHFLPTLPLWTGLIANSAFYAMLFLTVALLVGPARRAYRRRHLLCTHCRYNLRGLTPGSPCPECGHTP